MKKRKAGQDARTRLQQDLSDVESQHYSHMAVQPISLDDLSEWHVNIVPRTGDLQGSLFHLTFSFSSSYPDSPPEVVIFAPLLGERIIDSMGKRVLALDVLHPTKGWNSGRAITEILQHVERMLSQYSGDPEHIEDVKRFTKQYTCAANGHTYKDPVPRPKCIKNKKNSQPDSKTYVNNPSAEWQVAKATSGVDFGKVMYEATLDKVDVLPSNFAEYNAMGNPREMCSCRFGWATDDSEETAISGIFYGNGKSSHIVIRSKTKIHIFEELGVAETFRQRDVISAGVDFEMNSAWFARNGKKVGKAEGYPLPEFLQGKKLYPVVGLQNSAVQLNFSQPSRIVPGTEGFVTINKHKSWTRTDYLWKTRKNVSWSALFTPSRQDPISWKTSFEICRKGSQLTSAIAGQVEQSVRKRVDLMSTGIPVFKFLSAADLKSCQAVCKAWRKLIAESYLLQSYEIRCFHSRQPFSSCIVGLGINIQHSSDGLNIVRVTSPMEYLSNSAWSGRSKQIRRGPSGVEYTHFLPLIINEEHAAKSVPLLRSHFLQSYLPKEKIEWNEQGILDVITALMNGTVSALATDAEEPSAETIRQQLQLYIHLLHMFFYLNKLFENTISSLATNNIASTLQNKEKLELEALPDTGTLLLSTAITPNFQWRNLRKPVLLELFDREVPQYLSRFPELELLKSEEDPQQDPQVYLGKVVDCTVFERRKTMLQVFFTSNTNHSLSNNRSDNACVQVQSPDAQLLPALATLNARFGSCSKEQISQTIAKVQEIFAENSWDVYFTHLLLKPQEQIFCQNLIIESVIRAKQKRYFVSQYQEEPAPDAASQEEEAMYEEQPSIQNYIPQPPRIHAAKSFAELAPPLAGALETCDMLDLQKEVLPRATLQQEAIVISPLGTGKHTLAAITVINTLLCSPQGSQVLVLVPERNQAIHFEEILKDVYISVPASEMNGAKKLVINVVICAAKERYPQANVLNSRNVMVGTTGRIIDLIERGQIDPGMLKAVYVMEADTMLTRSLEQTVKVFLNVMQGIQVVFFSSTYSTAVQNQMGRLVEDAMLFDKTTGKFEDNFKHWYVACVREPKKGKILEKLCAEMQFEQALVFVRDGDRAKHFTEELESTGRSGPVGYLHNHLDPELRRETVKDFNDQKMKILITEDLSLYGLRTSNVDCIIHIDVPQKFSNNPETAMDAYYRRLSNVLKSSEVRMVKSICFAIRSRHVTQFLTELQDTHGLDELPADPNSV